MQFNRGADSYRLPAERTQPSRRTGAADDYRSTRLDPESFHEFLGGSIVAQETGVDMKSLSDLLHLQQSIATGEFDLNRSIYLIAKHARTVANATGVAIGLLEEDQLVYQVGSGSAAVLVGQRVMATLSTSERNRGDILRVENAQADTRIAAEICRQFGANSLLMVPIYHEGMVAGVLQVLFSEQHTFGYAEMGAYRLMAGLLEEAIWYAAHPEKKRALAESNVPQPSKRTLLHEQRWQAAVATVLVLVSLIARDRLVAPRVEVSTLARSVANGQAELAAKGHSGSSPQTERRRTEEARQSERRMPRWVWVGENELDYLAPDVTMRFFTPASPERRGQRGESHIEYIGEDVTVRYFAPRDAPALPELPAGSARQVHAN
jgi:hypothetical protein